MQRDFVRRLLSMLGILLLLGSSSADAFALHRCAHHDALPEATDTTSAHGEHHEHAPSSDEETSHGCTCVGTCATSSAVVAPRAHADVIAAAPDALHVQRAVRSAIMPDAPRYLLPPSTAPPTSF